MTLDDLTLQKHARVGAAQPGRVLWQRRWPKVVGFVALAAWVAVTAAARASEQRIDSDFHVFWQAGYDFTHGLPLYQGLPGARKFIYPPFAAQVFQVLGLFPLKTAAWLFYVASVGLVFVAIRISRTILKQLSPTKSQDLLPLVLAFLFSANFILNNLTMVQVNLLIFVLCLLGIQAFVAQREVPASGWLAAATAIKLTPLFFVVWAVIRGTRRTFAAVLAFGALCLTLPMFQRGFAQGLEDLTAYYDSFLRKFAGGGVVSSYMNQNLASMIYRAFVPLSSGDPAGYDYAYLPSLQTVAPLIYHVLAAAILGVFLAHVISLRIRGRPIGALEIASVFLASDLLSGVTWKAHLVNLLFVFCAFFSLDRTRMSRVGRIVLGFVWAGIVAIGLGRDIIGGRLYHYAAGYSIIVWAMLLLFGLSVVWSQKREEKTLAGSATA